MSKTVESRARFRDVKPYEAPESLAELTGPRAGVVSLPVRLRWVPGDRAYDVGELGGARVVYQAVLAEGRVQDQREFLNRDRLVEVWPELSLDERVVALWEDRFEELRGRAWIPGR